MSDYLIIMPAYNEADCIENVLENMKPYKDNTIIINDGSIDSTKEIIRECGFNCIDNKYNAGVAKCINQGIDYALENHIAKIILMDADGQHNPVYIPQFLTDLKQYDYVFGCRYHENELISTNKWASNLFASSLYAELTGHFFSDVSCGFKGMHLNSRLIKSLRSSYGFSIIYDIVNCALMTQASISIIPMEAIYYYNELLYTRIGEITALLNSIGSLKRQCTTRNDYIEQIIHTVSLAIKEKKKFHVNLVGVDFWAFPICDDGYLFQIDPKNIVKWLEKCHTM